MLKKFKKLSCLHFIILSFLFLISCSDVQNERFNTDVPREDQSHKKVPQLVSTTENNDLISISWQAPLHKSDVKSYKIYRCDTKEDQKTCIVLDNINAQEVSKTEDKKTFLFQDIPPKKNTLYYYTVSSILKSDSSESKKSNPSSAILSDKDIPGTVQNFTAVAIKESIILSWTKNTDSDLKGYNIYYEAPRRSLQKLNTSLIDKNTTSFTHVNPDNNLLYTYTIKAVDMVDKESNVSNEVSGIIDTNGPSITFSKKPGKIANLLHNIFNFQSNEPLKTCTYSVNAENSKSCHENQDIVISNLKEGNQIITFLVTDLNSNSTKITYTWFLDFTKPDLTITSSPAKQTGNPIGRFTIDTNDNNADLFYSIDGKSYIQSQSPFQIKNLTHGPHTISIKIRDKAQNETVQSYQWFVDTESPDIILFLEKPNAALNNFFTLATIKSDDSKAKLSYTYNADAPKEIDVSNVRLLSNEGKNTLLIRATDQFGNTSEKIQTWELNTFNYALGNVFNEDFTFSRQSGIFEDKFGKIYVADSRRHRVQVYNAQHRYLFSIGEKDKSNNSAFDDDSFNKFLKHPTDVAIDSSGLIYVSDSHNRIQVFKANGTYLRTIGKPNNENSFLGTGRDQFNLPSGLAIDNSLGVIYVADLGNQRVKIHKLNGTYNGEITQAGGLTLLNPIDVAVDSNQNIYILDQGRHCIFIFNKEGQYIKSIGQVNTPGTSSAHFNSPSGIFIDESDELFVADTANHRTLSLSLEGKINYIIGETSKRGDSTQRLSSPISVFANGNGQVFISDTGNNIIKVYNR